MNSRKLRKIRSEERKVIEKFFRKISLGDHAYSFVDWEKIYVLDLKEASYNDVYEVTEELLNFVDDRFFYIAGLYMGLIYRTSKGIGFKPGLPLARKLSKLCQISIRCYILNEKGEKKFLYGKIVPESFILESEDKGLGLVVNTQKEALGWGRVEIVGKYKRLVPVIDLGWYLRRGG